MKTLDEATATALEAAAFRRLVAHLQARTDVQNIDLMTLAGFCRNCLSNWLEEAAAAQAVPLTRAQAREHVYGMPHEEWKRRFQREAAPAQAAAFAAAAPPSHAGPPADEPHDPAAPAPGAQRQASRS